MFVHHSILRREMKGTQVVLGDSCTANVMSLIVAYDSANGLPGQFLLGSVKNTFVLQLNS